MAHTWVEWLHNLYRSRVANDSKRGTKSVPAHKLADWLHKSSHRGGGGDISNQRKKPARARKQANCLHNLWRLRGSKNFTT